MISSPKEKLTNHPQFRCRFAPSPTGQLHIGNIRTALINWLYARKNNGTFILRIDDTDTTRIKEEYLQDILQSLKWIGLNWDDYFTQSGRTKRYQEVIETLTAKGKIYPCYETEEELEIKRKLALSRGMPPIYNREALNLTKNEQEILLSEGKKPHYRFMIDQGSEIKWNDLIKGEISYQGRNIGDPIVIRSDGTLTYLLCSTIDDIDYQISHIIRGEDHITNTAIQIQMFDSLDSKAPHFGHLGLLVSKDSKISKRTGGFSVQELKNALQLEPITIASFLSTIGSNKPLKAYNNLAEIVEEFEITSFSHNRTIYMPEDLLHLNHKTILHLSYQELVQNHLNSNPLKDQITESQWLILRPNINNLNELEDWWQIISPKSYELLKTKALDLNKELIFNIGRALQNVLDQGYTTEDASFLQILVKQTLEIAPKSPKSEIYTILRKLLTGKDTGPELKGILRLLGPKEIQNRLQI